MGGHRKFKRAAPLLVQVPPICLALALGGCAVGPDFIPPEVPVQNNWIESKDSRVASNTDIMNLLVAGVQGSDARSPDRVRI